MYVYDDSFKPVTFIPKVIFGEDGVIQTFGVDYLPIFISIAMKTNPTRKTAVTSIYFILRDCGLSVDSGHNRVKVKRQLTDLCDKGFIEIEDARKRTHADAVEIKINYELQPFIKFYDVEYKAIQNLKTNVKIANLHALFLYIVSFINDRSKNLVWTSMRNAATALNSTPNTIHRYLNMLIDEAKVLKFMGSKPLAEIYPKQHRKLAIIGNAMLYTRNMPEYYERKDNVYIDEAD